MSDKIEKAVDILVEQDSYLLTLLDRVNRNSACVYRVTRSGFNYILFKLKRIGWVHAGDFETEKELISYLEKMLKDIGIGGL